MPGTQGRAAAASRLNTTRLWQLALAFLAGNQLALQLPALPTPAWLLLLTGLALAVLARRGLGACSLAAVLLLGLCWTAQAAWHGLTARWPAALDGDDVELTGWIDSLPRRDAGRTMFTLRVQQAATAIPLGRVRLSWYEPAPDLAAGQTLAIEARLRAPRGLANPGGLDYERWLFVEGFDATGYVRSGEVVTAASPTIAQGWLQWRMQIATRIRQLVASDDAAALLTALSLGERGSFTDRHWDVLQRTGTSHLVAVSGLHVGLVAMFAFVVLLRVSLYLPYVLARHAHAMAALGSLVPAAVYAALAGFALPTQRALVMLLVAQLLLISKNRIPLVSGLALALLAVLMLDPLASLSASFWLSFGAVALLLAAATGRLRTRLFEYLRLQWVLTLGLAPLVIWYFGLVSLASFPVNLIAIPVFSLLLVPLSLLLVLAVIVGIGGPVIAALAEPVAQGAWTAIGFAAGQPLAAFSLPQASFIAFSIATLAVMLALPRHPLPGRRLALLGLMPLVISAASRLEYGQLRFTVLDVGQGLALLLETRTQTWVYDAGPLYQSGFDVGADIIVPALTALGEDAPDRLIVSHADNDHSGGAAAIIDRYPDIHVLGGPDVDAIVDQECRAGQIWMADGVTFEILHPAENFSPTGNESSCVLRVVTDNGTLLVTGDIERIGESRLLRTTDPRADVVIVPHHGSLTSSTEPFVAAVAADIAIVSAGFNNRWGFPRPEVRERWLQTGAQLLVTGSDGAVTGLIDERGISLSTAREQRRRFWQPEREPSSGVRGQSAL